MDSNIEISQMGIASLVEENVVGLKIPNSRVKRSDKETAQTGMVRTDALCPYHAGKRGQKLAAPCRI